MLICWTNEIFKVSVLSRKQGHHISKYTVWTMILDDVKSFGPEISEEKLTEPCLFFVMVLQWLPGVDCNLCDKMQNVLF